MFIAKVNLKIKNKEIQAGDMVDRPAKWLIEQGLVEKIDKRFKENKLQETVKIDDIDTEFEEVGEEE